MCIGGGHVYAKSQDNSLSRMQTYMYTLKIFFSDVIGVGIIVDLQKRNNIQTVIGNKKEYTSLLTQAIFSTFIICFLSFAFFWHCELFIKIQYM